MPEITGISVNPEEAIAFFRAKGFRLEPTWDWQDFKARDHAASFTVAKSAGFDILQDIHDAVDDAIAKGETLRDFEKRLTPILQEKGWWGKQEVINPETGEAELVQLGSPRRLRTIFQTNLNMAYMAGKWQRFQRLKDKRPWLRYVTVQDNRVRHSHKAWHGTILHIDDPWWDIHFPPNDWGCRCDVIQLSDRDLERYKLKVSPRAPQGLSRGFINKKTGSVDQLPDGIKPGFDHNVGIVSNEAHAGKQLADRLASMAPELAARAGAASQAFALSGISYEYQAWANRILAAAVATGEVRVVGSFSKTVLDNLDQRQLPPSSAAISISDHDILHLTREAKAAAQRIALSDLLRLPQLLARPQAVLWDKRHNNLVYVYDATDTDRSGKLVISINWRGKLPPDSKGARQSIAINKVKSAGVVPIQTLRDENTYEVVEGSL